MATSGVPSLLMSPSAARAPPRKLTASIPRKFARTATAAPAVATQTTTVKKPELPTPTSKPVIPPNAPREPGK